MHKASKRHREKKSKGIRFNFQSSLLQFFAAFCRFPCGWLLVVITFCKFSKFYKFSGYFFKVPFDDETNKMVQASQSAKISLIIKVFRWQKYGEIALLKSNLDLKVIEVVLFNYKLLV